MNDLFNVDSRLLSGLNNFFGNLFRAAKDSYSLTEYNEQKRFYKEVISKLIMNGLKHADYDEESKHWELDGYEMGHQYPEQMNQLHRDFLCARLTVAQQLEKRLQDRIEVQEQERAEQERRLLELSEKLERFRDVGFVLGEIISKVDHNPLMECAVCFRPYSRTIIPHIGECGHSICKRCTKWIKKTDCPVCRCKESFDEPIKNFLATELMSHFRNENPHALIDDDPFENEVPDYDNQEATAEEEAEGEGEDILAEEQERLWAQILAENERRAQRQALQEQMAREAAARPRTVEEDVAALVTHLVDMVVAPEEAEEEDDSDDDEETEGENPRLEPEDAVGQVVDQEKREDVTEPAKEDGSQRDGASAADPVPAEAPIEAASQEGDENQDPEANSELEPAGKTEEMAAEVPMEPAEPLPTVETGAN